MQRGRVSVRAKEGGVGEGEGVGLGGKGKREGLVGGKERKEVRKQETRRTLAEVIPLHIVSHDRSSEVVKM